MTGDLANAPLITTDIPTSDTFINQVGPTQNNYIGSYMVNAVGDANRRYYLSPSSTVMLAMDNVPNSFGIDASQKGIIGVVASYGYDGSTTLRVAMHQPTANVRDFITGWDIISGATELIPQSGTEAQFSGTAAVCSQRQGEYAYVFMYLASYGTFSSGFKTTIYKVTRDEYLQIAAVSGGSQVIDGAGTDPTVPVIQVQNGGQFFVSDEEEPFIWNVSGTVANGGQAQMTGFRDDNSQNVGSYYTSYNQATQATKYHYSGQSAAYLQNLTLPAGVYGYGPYIVHPWASGNYGPPELWFFVNEFDSTGFKTTGRYLIYRSQWKTGLYQLPPNVVLTDDPDFTAGRLQYPTLNPYGYAWETNFIDDDHYVGTVGPFTLDVYNPQSNIIATIQNQQYGSHGTPIGTPNGYSTGPNGPGSLPFGFSVVRDKKRYGVLHVVALDGGSYPVTTPQLNRVWFANSQDDGATWSRMEQINPAIQPASQGTFQSGTVGTGAQLGQITMSGQPTPIGLQRSDQISYSQWGGSTIGMPSIVRTHDDVLLMGNIAIYTQYTVGSKTPPYYVIPADAGSKVALAVIDYTGRGTGIYNANPVVFVQQTSRGQTSWQ